jgi:hypothetical protein
MPTDTALHLALPRFTLPLLSNSPASYTCADAGAQNTYRSQDWATWTLEETAAAKTTNIQKEAEQDDYTEKQQQDDLALASDLDEHVVATLVVVVVVVVVVVLTVAAEMKIFFGD